MGPGAIVESALRGASAQLATEIFILVIGAVLVVALWQGFTGKHGRFLEMAPNLLTSLGILGTFVGIVIGLLDFNTSNIDESIQKLLEGLKTAFITSLAGMTASILLKAIDGWKFAPMRDQNPEDGEVTGQHIFTVLKASLDQQRGIDGHLGHLVANFEKVDQQLHRLEAKSEQMIKAIAGTEEGTLVGQFKLLRTDFSDFRTSQARTHTEFEAKLFQQLREFADTLAKSATETVIEALRQVIVDFNRNLVEQFGQNFQALDQSVQKLVLWQEGYKTHLEAMQARLEQAIASVERTAAATESISESLRKADESIGSIDQSCQKIPSAMQDLSQVMTVNQHQLAELARHLDAFVATRDKAVQAVPEIKQRMDQLCNELKSSVQTLQESLHEGAQEFGKSVDRTTAAVTEMSHVVAATSETMRKDLTDTSTTFTKAMSNALAQLNEATARLPAQLQTVVQGFGEAVQGNVATVIESVRKAVEASIKDSQSHIRDASTTMMSSVKAQIENASKHAVDSINQQLRTMDKAMEDELNKVFSAFGRALTTISKTIVDEHEAFRRRQGMGQ